MSIKKDEPFRVQLGQKIKKYRLAHRLTQAELGRRIGISYTQIQKYENGTSYILASRLYDLAEALSIDIISLLTDIPLNLHKTYDEKVQELVREYSKIKTKKLRSIVYLLVKSISQANE